MTDGDKTVLVPAVGEAMYDLLVTCPPHPGEVDTDRVRVTRVWARETHEFEPEIVAEAFHSLLTRNPRNPFRPSVQDIVERCRSIRKEWVRSVEQFFLGERSDEPPAWCAQIVVAVLRGVLENSKECWHHNGGMSYYGKARPPEITPEELAGHFMAKMCRQWNLGRWPQDLLAEFGVLSGADFERVDNALTRRLLTKQNGPS